ncbi:F-box/kelch-repeat protein [Raphanus sativus]|nr:F-box/kelch-repeat protein [Raphanus sativus]
MELIPHLPETLARECLLRTSYKQFPLISSVCKVWKREISLPDFLQHRKVSGHSQELVVLSQARVDPVSQLGSGKKHPHAPVPDLCSRTRVRFMDRAAFGSREIQRVASVL